MLQVVFADRKGSAVDRERVGHKVPDEETGATSRAVTSRLRMTCAGWQTVPTAAEFHAAPHRPAGTDRETAMLLTWFHVAAMEEQVDARLDWKGYILPLLFFRRMSDVWDEETAEARAGRGCGGPDPRARANKPDWGSDTNM